MATGLRFFSGNYEVKRIDEAKIPTLVYYNELTSSREFNLLVDSKKELDEDSTAVIKSRDEPNDERE